MSFRQALASSPRNTALPSLWSSLIREYWFTFGQATLKSLSLLNVSFHNEVKKVLQNSYSFRGSLVATLTVYEARNIFEAPDIACTHIHSSCLSVHFTYTFNQQVDNKLPTTITSIKFGNAFNQAVDNLPPNLTHLSFLHYFNQPVDHLPSHLTHLSFGIHFDHPIDSLPTSLTHLYLGQYFNQPISKLPSSLVYFGLPYGVFNKSIDHLPSKLACLNVTSFFNQPTNNLPASITHLTLGDWYNQPIDFLPNGLKYLQLGDTFNQPIDHLPQTLLHLIFNRYSCAFNQPIDSLPATLTHLKLGHSFNQPLNNLPPSLSHLTLGASFSHQLDHLSTTIKYLTLKTFDEQQGITLEQLENMQITIQTNSRNRANSFSGVEEMLSDYTPLRTPACKICSNSWVMGLKKFYTTYYY